MAWGRWWSAGCLVQHVVSHYTALIRSKRVSIRLHRGSREWCLYMHWPNKSSQLITTIWPIRCPTCNGVHITMCSWYCNPLLQWSVPIHKYRCPYARGQSIYIYATPPHSLHELIEVILWLQRIVVWQLLCMFSMIGICLWLAYTWLALWCRTVVCLAWLDCVQEDLETIALIVWLPELRAEASVFRLQLHSAKHFIIPLAVSATRRHRNPD